MSDFIEGGTSVIAFSRVAMNRVVTNDQRLATSVAAAKFLGRDQIGAMLAILESARGKVLDATSSGSMANLSFPDMKWLKTHNQTRSFLETVSELVPILCVTQSGKPAVKAKAFKLNVLEIN